MKGNLSKKKGFLGDVLGNDEIKSISDTLEARIDKRIANAEGDIGGIKENIPILKKELETYTDEMVYEAYKGIENLEEAIKEKEDVSNKVMAVDDDGRYYSGEMTEMRIYQVIDEHIVQDLNVPKEDRIPSVKAVSEAIKGIKPDIDLSDYYTKEETDSKDEKLQQDIYDLQADIVGREEKINQVQDISNNLSLEKYPSTVAVFDYGQSLISSCNSFTAGYVAQEIGNIETALENIIEKYGLGGDAS